MKIENVNIERNRIWVPREIQEKIFEKFVEITIRKNQREKSFLSRMNKDRRIVIPYKYAEDLGFNKKHDVAKIEIDIIRNKKRSSNLFRGKSFDVLSFIPQNTFSGFEILAVENKGKINLWYSTKGRPNNVQINRFLPMNFSRLLGYYQAEGGKPKLMKRRGRELSFTNTSLEIIKEFLDLSRNAFKSDIWSATIRYNQDVDKSEIDNLILLLSEKGLHKEKIRYKKAERISKYTIKLWITNSILAEIIFNMSNKIMEYAAGDFVNSSDVRKYFLQGLIAGDGSLHVWRDKNNSQHSVISIYEGKEKYVECYRRLMEKIHINGKIRKDVKKNLFMFYSYLNWNDVLRLRELEIFHTKEHSEKLKNAILHHKRYKALKFLAILPKEFPTSTFSRISNKSYVYSATWLRDREEECIIKRIGKDKNEIVWKLTENGEKTKDLLKNLIYIN